MHGPHVFSPSFAFDFYLQRPRNYISGTRKRKDGYWILVARTAECCDHRYIQRYEIPLEMGLVKRSCSATVSGMDVRAWALDS